MQMIKEISHLNDLCPVRQENKGMKTKAEEMANESRKLQHQLETARFTVEESQKKIDFYQKNQSTLQIELNKEMYV